MERDFGELIRIGRILHSPRLSQRELAERLGVSLWKLWRWENSVSSPPLAVAQNLAKVLKYPPLTKIINHVVTAVASDQERPA